VRISERLFGFLGSTPNWIGLGMASIVLVLKGMGLVGTPGLGLAVMGYVAGFVAAGMWFGFPSFTGPAWEALHFSDEGDAREAMERALHGVRGLTQYNPENRLPGSLQARVLEFATRSKRSCNNGRGHADGCRWRIVSTRAASPSSICLKR